MAKVHFNKYILREENVEIYATTVDTEIEVMKITKTLEKKGFTVNVVIHTVNDAFWYNVSGKRQWKSDAEILENRLNALKAPCGSGCGFYY